jgi:hypothetical protein
MTVFDRGYFLTLRVVVRVVDVFPERTVIETEQVPVRIAVIDVPDTRQNIFDCAETFRVIREPFGVDTFR